MATSSMGIVAVEAHVCSVPGSKLMALARDPDGLAIDAGIQRRRGAAACRRDLDKLATDAALMLR